jgi:hypothetical protein
MDEIADSGAALMSTGVGVLPSAAATTSNSVPTGR